MKELLTVVESARPVLPPVDTLKMNRDVDGYIGATSYLSTPIDPEWAEGLQERTDAYYKSEERVIKLLLALVACIVFAALWVYGSEVFHLGFAIVALGVSIVLYLASLSSIHSRWHLATSCVRSLTYWSTYQHKSAYQINKEKGNKNA